MAILQTMDVCVCVCVCMYVCVVHTCERCVLVYVGWVGRKGRV